MIYIFIFPFVSVVLGYLLLLVLKRQYNVKLLLTFSGSFMLSLIFFDILPDVYDSIPKLQSGLFVMLGILLQVILEFFSKGAEHGHFQPKNKTFPYLLFLALCLHSIFEGLPLWKNDILLLGITLHKLPIAIILGGFFIRSGYSNVKVLLYLILFSITTPIGSCLGVYFSFIDHFQYQISAMVIGVLFHISTTILFEISEGHKFNFQKMLFIALGILIACLLLG